MNKLYEYFETGADDTRPLPVGQSFTPSSNHTIIVFSLQLYRARGSSGTITLSIRSGSSTGTVIASGILDGASVTTDNGGAWYDIDLGIGAELTSNTKYWATVVRSGDYELRWKENTSGGYAGGNAIGGDGSDLVNEDYYFREYGPELPSISPSASISASISPSASLSPSASISPSASLSPSSSESPSPSAGYSLYTRNDEANLPTNDANLSTVYTDQEETDVSLRDNIFVGQTGALNYMIHQFKKFVGSQTECNVEWEGQSTLAPDLSPVYLEIYNQATNEWEIVDFIDDADSDTNFELSAIIKDLTDYKNDGIISCRVYQLAI